MTTAPVRSSASMELISKIRRGWARHDPAPLVAVLPHRPALRSRKLAGIRLAVHRPHELGGILHGRIVGVHFDHRENRGDRFLRRDQVPELLFDEVADHALGLGTEDVERVGGDIVVAGRLQRQQPDLRAVAVRNHQLMVDGHRRKCLACGLHVRPLTLDGHGLTSLLKRISPKCNHDSHTCLHSAPTT